MRKSACSALMAASVILLAFSASSCVVAMKYAGGLASLAVSKTETRSVTPFTSIRVYGQSQLNLHQGAQKIVVTAAFDDLSDIETTVSGSQLTIGTSKKLDAIGPAPTYDITIPVLEGVAVSDNAVCDIYDFTGASFSCAIDGSGDIYGSGLSYDAVTLSASGYGGINLDNLVASKLKCDVSGWVSLTGKADSASFALSGSGEVHTSTSNPFTAENAKVVSSGSGSIQLRATKTLDATISGSGNVYYWGNPTITRDVTGSGALIKED
jgi:hypothetical protein